MKLFKRKNNIPKSVKIHPTAIIYDNVVICDNVEIGAYSVIGAPAEIKGQERQSLGTVYIGSNTIITEHVTIHSPRQSHSRTEIGYNCFIQAHSHIGHDVLLHNYVTVACYACLGGHTVVHDYANLALHTVTHPRSIIGEGTILGCNSFAKGQLSKWSVYVGSPAKRIKANNHLRKKLNLAQLYD